MSHQPTAYRAHHHLRRGTAAIQPSDNFPKLSTVKEQNGEEQRHRNQSIEIAEDLKKISLHVIAQDSGYLEEPNCLNSDLSANDGKKLARSIQLSCSATTPSMIRSTDTVILNDEEHDLEATQRIKKFQRALLLATSNPSTQRQCAVTEYCKNGCELNQWNRSFLRLLLRLVDVSTSSENALASIQGGFESP